MKESKDFECKDCGACFWDYRYTKCPKCGSANIGPAVNENKELNCKSCGHPKSSHDTGGTSSITLGYIECDEPGCRCKKFVNEGVFKPGERSTWGKCPKCRGKGTRSLTTTPDIAPCSRCRGTGKVATGPADPSQYFLTGKEKDEVTRHLQDMPPAKKDQVKQELISLKNLTEGFYDKMDVSAELRKLIKCSDDKADSIVSGFTSGASLDQMRKYWAAVRKRNFKKAAQIIKSEWLDEMSATAGVGGYNAPLGAGYKTDKKGIKHNFKVTEMKTFKKLVKEAEKKVPDTDLSRFDKSFTAFLERKSKSGELQKQFSKDYSVEKFMSWVRAGLEKEGAQVSDSYLDRFETRLTGNSKKDLFVTYSAFLKGAGLGVAEDE